ncbi:MAG: hypothetical protein JOY93_03825, partial [Acidobacteriales bacterium]|nr:hypothetical protein [Terriglobales bacterium]
NRDGNSDLAVANSCITGADCGNGSVGVLLGDGNGTFQLPIVTSADMRMILPNFIFSGTLVATQEVLFPAPRASWR